MFVPFGKGFATQSHSCLRLENQGIIAATRIAEKILLSVQHLALSQSVDLRYFDNCQIKIERERGKPALLRSKGHNNQLF
jgi:hypothetical protein